MRRLSIAVPFYMAMTDAAIAERNALLRTLLCQVCDRELATLAVCVDLGTESVDRARTVLRKLDWEFICAHGGDRRRYLENIVNKAKGLEKLECSGLCSICYANETPRTRMSLGDTHLKPKPARANVKLFGFVDDAN